MDSDEDEEDNEYEDVVEDCENEEDDKYQVDTDSDDEDADEHGINLKINPPKTKNHPNHKDRSTLETPLSISEQETINAHQTDPSLPAPNSVTETHTSPPPPPPIVNSELEADTVIALGRHHIWI